MNNYVRFIKRLFTQENDVSTVKIPLILVADNKVIVNKKSNLYLANTGKNIPLTLLADTFSMSLDSILEGQKTNTYEITKTNKGCFISYDNYARYVAYTHNI